MHLRLIITFVRVRVRVLLRGHRVEQVVLRRPKTGQDTLAGGWVEQVQVAPGSVEDAVA